MGRQAGRKTGTHTRRKTGRLTGRLLDRLTGRLQARVISDITIQCTFHHDKCTGVYKLIETFFIRVGSIIALSFKAKARF